MAKADPAKRAVCGDIEQVCEHLGMNYKKQLYLLRKKDPTFPKPVYLHGPGSRKPYWVWAEVDAWWQAHIIRQRRVA